jgi:hypothetical protein
MSGNRISVTASYHGPCPVCKKLIRRCKDFWQDVSASNTDERGNMKTAEVITREVELAAARWKKEQLATIGQEMHKACRDKVQQ